MGRQTNLHMEKQIKIRCWQMIIMIFFSISSDAQVRNCTPLKILKDVRNKSFKYNDTLHIAFQNTSVDTIEYQMDVMMLINGKWTYSPHYTRYFNRDLSYAKMKSIFNSKLPVTFSQDYYHPPGVLKPNEIGNFFFQVERTERSKTLIKLRLHVLNGMDKCALLCFAPFLLVKIKE